jgi:RimJ/RimL family protein N-acetyltransferase
LPHGNCAAERGADGAARQSLPRCTRVLAGNISAVFLTRTMRHDIQFEGFGMRVRPVRMEDAAFIVWLRNLEHVRGRVGDSAGSVAAQEAWLERYFEREGDYYFTVETQGGIPLGTHGIYDLVGTTAVKGRHIIRPEVYAGVPAGTLATDIGFERLGLTEMRSTCVSTNRQVRSLHLKTGFREVGILRAAQMIEGRPADLLQFLLTPEEWKQARPKLIPLAELAGKKVLEWEKTQINVTQPWC